MERCEINTDHSPFYEPKSMLKIMSVVLGALNSIQITFYYNHIPLQVRKTLRAYSGPAARKARNYCPNLTCLCNFLPANFFDLKVLMLT